MSDGKPSVLLQVQGVTELDMTGLTECGLLEKGMANHFSILALRIP